MSPNDFKNENNIKKKYEFLTKIIDNLPVQIGYWSADLINVFCCDMYAKFLNSTKEQLIGKHMRDVIGDEYFERNKPYVKGVLSGQAQVFERKLRPNPFGFKYLLVHFVPDINEQDEIVGFFVHSSDITKIKDQAEELDKERAKVVQVSKLSSLGEMSAGIAHEINNPLTIISGTVRSILKTLSNKKLSKDLLQSKMELIQKSITRMEHIVKSLQKYARTSEPSKKKAHVLHNIILESIVLTSGKANQEKVLLTPPLFLEAKILCDEIEIEQVFVNLLSNAMDAIRNLSEKWVRINAYEDEEFVYVEVHDSGLGISKDIENKIFQPFFTTKPVGQGTGLGLTIVKGILDDHQAKIELVHELGHTCFRLSFIKN